MRAQELMDAHAHLYGLHDMPGILQRCEDAGVTTVIAVAETVDTFEEMVQLAHTHAAYSQLVKPSLGVHPCHADSFDRDRMVRALTTHNVAGIGEVGLDFSPHILPLQPKHTQYHAFRQQLLLAREHQMSVNVHSRQAGHYAIAELHQHGIHRALLHAFDGKASYIREALLLGYCFSVAPCIAHQDKQRTLAQLVPMDRLLVESDTPALARTKGGRSEPADVLYVAQEIATIKHMPLEAVTSALAHNTRRLFGI